MRRRLGPLTLLTIACILLAVGHPAAAGNWNVKLKRIEKTLENGRWQEARKASLKVRERLMNQVDRPPLVPASAARTLMLQALAEAGLGNDHAARWYWLAAQSYLQGLPALNLERFGRAGELLEDLAADQTPMAWLAPAPAADETYRSPTVLKARPPVYPRSLKSASRGEVRLEVVVGTDGRAHRPRVLDAGPVVMAAFPVLDAVRTWRFEPARRGDRAVNVVYRLSLPYP